MLQNPLLATLLESPKDFMQTEPLYLEDAYLKEMNAHILEATQESEKKWQVVLDKTVFYPLGGGQPTDQGWLSTDSWRGMVRQVLMKGDRIVHYVESDQPPPLGAMVKGALDWDRRYLNMRLHSACHVVDFAMYLLGYCPKSLVPVKGDSGKKPMIYYQGTVEKDIREDLEKKTAELIAKDLPFSFRFLGFDELQREAIYLQPGLPTNKPLRLLTLEGVGSVADGGTQVHSTKEVGAVTILPIEKKEGMTLIHLRVA